MLTLLHNPPYSPKLVPIPQESHQSHSSSHQSLYGCDFIVQRQHIRHWPNRSDGERIDLRVAPRVVILDVRHDGRLVESRHVPVQIPHPPVQVWVSASNVPDVALEMLDVDRVEPDERHIKPNVCFGDLVPKVKGSTGYGEVGLGSVERLEESPNVAHIGFLRGGKAGLVYAVVDFVVCPGVDLVDVGQEGLREKVYFWMLVLGVKEMVELRANTRPH